jgi:glyoxylase-like metal-dependent hydrolase (beta-lactamase superfamily II)
VLLSEKEPVRFGKSQLQVLHTPGHSPGGVCLYAAADGFVLAGDTLFAGSIGRTDLPGGDYDTLIKSIRTKLLTLSEAVKVLPGHGPATSISAELQSNPFIQ